MTCRGFQYEEGKEYEHDGEVELCKSGFHACEYPLDCFRYYSPNESVYHQVELHGYVETSNDSPKIVASKIKIGAELDIAGFVKASIEYTKERSVPEEGSSATGDYGASSATGDYGASSATGIRGSSYAGNETAIAVAWGFHGKAKGVLGAHIVLADWEGDGMVRLMEEEEKLLKEREKAVRSWREIQAAITSPELTSRQTEVCFKRYILRMWWDDIAEEMGVSQATIYRWHGEALQRIRIPKKKTNSLLNES